MALLSFLDNFLRPAASPLSKRQRKGLRYFLNTALPAILRGCLYGGLIPAICYVAKKSDPSPSWLTIFNPLM